jgi:hypothetical protein
MSRFARGLRGNRLVRELTPGERAMSESGADERRAMTDDELKAIEARANAATPDLEYGSVIDDESQQKEDVVFSITQGRVATLHGGLSLQTVDNGMFFTRARPDMLALVEEVRRLRRLLDGIPRPLKDATVETYGGPDFMRGWA